MLKQLSVPKKIFGAITLLSAICYVGTMVYVHDTSAEANRSADWIYYKARVNNITRSGNTFTVNTVHTARYHNHHEHQKRFKFRHSPQWHNMTDNTPVESAEENPIEWMIAATSPAGVYGTQVTYRSMDKLLTPGKTYRAGAYTNLFAIDWNNASVNLPQAEVFTDGFTIASFIVNSVPTVPVQDTNTSNHP